MNYLDKSIGRRGYKKIDVSHRPKGIVLFETTECYHPTTIGAGRFHAFKDVGGLTGTTDCHQKVSGMAVHGDRKGENAFISEVIAKAGQSRSVIEAEGPDAATFGEVDRHVTGDGGATAVTDKHYCVAGDVRLEHRRVDTREGLGNGQVTSKGIGNLRAGG